MKLFSATILITLSSVITILVSNVVARTTKQWKYDNKGDASYWLKQNEKTFMDKVKQLQYTFGTIGVPNKAKNVIFFLGDGMGLSTITAARLYKGNVDKTDPESGFLSFEKFPFTSLAKVNSLDETVADSAATATSYLCGVKTNHRNLGVSGNVLPNDCEASKIGSNRVTSIIHWAQQAGKATGVVTTTRVTHASPAATYAHSASRKWEHETNGTKCEDIASQLVFGDTGKNINVVLGGGRREFLPNLSHKSEQESGRREDGVNLVNSWLKQKLDRKEKANYVTTKEQLMKLNDNDANFVLGLFSSSHLEYNLDKPINSTEPSLSEMVEKTIRILRKNNNGFVVFVEGGRIDHAHHGNLAKKALDETYQFNKAIETALGMVNISETLIIVTADHSHSLTINGYQQSGGDILGRTFDDYTTLIYGNGPGYYRDNLTTSESTNKEYRQRSAAYRSSSAHAGEDIPVYATGPGSQFLTGVFDQTFIPHVVSASACIGPLASFCKTQEHQQITPIVKKH